MWVSSSLLFLVRFQKGFSFASVLKSEILFAFSISFGSLSVIHAKSKCASIWTRILFFCSVFLHHERASLWFSIKNILLLFIFIHQLVIQINQTICLFF